MNKKHIVLDTNILISGLMLPSSKPQQIFDRIPQWLDFVETFSPVRYNSETGLIAVVKERSRYNP